MSTSSSSYDAWIDAYGCLLSFDKQTWAFFCNFEFPGIHFIFCGFHPKMEVNQLLNTNINYAKCLTMKGNAFLNMFYGKLIQLCFQNNKKWNFLKFKNYPQNGSIWPKKLTDVKITLHTLYSILILIKIDKLKQFLSQKCCNATILSLEGD